MEALTLATAQLIAEDFAYESSQWATIYDLEASTELVFDALAREAIDFDLSTFGDTDTDTDTDTDRPRYGAAVRLHDAYAFGDAPPPAPVRI